jgi:hypothetical protein
LPWKEAQANDGRLWRPSEYRVDVLGCWHVMSFLIAWRRCGEAGHLPDAALAPAALALLDGLAA